MLSRVRQRDAEAAAEAVEAGRLNPPGALFHPGRSPGVVAAAVAAAEAGRVVLPVFANHLRMFASQEVAAASSRKRQEQPFLREQAASLS